jgi:hypothetical protein
MGAFCRSANSETEARHCPIRTVSDKALSRVWGINPQTVMHYRFQKRCITSKLHGFTGGAPSPSFQGRHDVVA